MSDLKINPPTAQICWDEPDPRTRPAALLVVNPRTGTTIRDPNTEDLRRALDTPQGRALLEELHAEKATLRAELDRVRAKHDTLVNISNTHLRRAIDAEEADKTYRRMYPVGRFKKLNLEDFQRLAHPTPVHASDAALMQAYEDGGGVKEDGSAGGSHIRGLRAVANLVRVEGSPLKPAVKVECLGERKPAKPRKLETCLLRRLLARRVSFVVSESSRKHWDLEVSFADSSVVSRHDNVPTASVPLTLLRIAKLEKP